MNKILTASILLLSVSLCGCATTVDTVEQEHVQYYQSGRYYTFGELITNDGNVWEYTQDIISEEQAYNNEPVYAVFDDNGTPENIYDDAILGLVLDRETAIYDALEVALSAEFNLDRDGNNIRIHGEKGEN